MSCSTNINVNVNCLQAAPHQSESPFAHERGFQNTGVCPQVFPRLRTQSPRKRLLRRLYLMRNGCVT